MEAHIPMDATILRKWLAAGYIDKEVFYPTEAGMPQGGIASPSIANMVLDGLEQAASKAAPRQAKVHVTRFADDFIVTGASKEVLEHRVKPAIEAFLHPRGLELSAEKTKITHLDNGFDFLGYNLRKYNGKLIIKPAKANVNALLAKVREVIKSNPSATTVNLIQQLNPMIRGWANYHRHVVAKKTFARVDTSIYLALQRWIKRRHPNKNARWQRQRYFRSQGFRHWIFSTKVRHEDGSTGDTRRVALPYIGYEKLHWKGAHFQAFGHQASSLLPRCHHGEDQEGDDEREPTPLRNLEERDQDSHRDGYYIRSEERRGHLETLDRTQHGDRRSDDAVTVEESRPEETCHDQDDALLGRGLRRRGYQGRKGDDTPLAVVGRSHHEDEVLDGDDDDQGPEDQRQDTEYVGWGWIESVA